MSNVGYTVQSTILLQQTSFTLARPSFGKMSQRWQVEKCKSHNLRQIFARQIICRDLHSEHYAHNYQARARRARARRASALRALGLLLADGTPTVGGGKTF